MNVDIRCQPSYAVAFCILEAGEEMLCERGAMVALSAGIEAGAGLGSGGVMGAVSRKALGRESFFMGRYRAHAHHAWVAIAPPMPGDIAITHLDGSQGLIVQQGSFLGADGGIHVDIKIGGMRTMLMREGLTVLRVQGVGTALIASYGGLLPFDLGVEESMVVDTGHLVAWSDTVSMQIGFVGGAVKSAASGEGLAATMTGPGTLWIQTRSEGDLTSWLFPHPNEGPAAGQ